MDTVMADGDAPEASEAPDGFPEFYQGQRLLHTLAVLVLASTVEEGRDRVDAGMQNSMLPLYDIVIEHDDQYSIDGRVRFLVYCYQRKDVDYNRYSMDDQHDADELYEPTLGWVGGGGGGGTKSVQEMRDLVRNISVLNGKVGYVAPGKPYPTRLCITPTSKMTAKEVVRELVLADYVQNHMIECLAAPLETLIITVQKNSSSGRDEREIPTTFLTVTHPLPALHLMLCSIRGKIRQQSRVHSTNIQPLPLLLELARDNAPNPLLDRIHRKLPGVGLYLQLLRYPGDAGRNLGEQRILQHAHTLVEGCTKWDRKEKELDHVGPVGVSVYVVHEDFTTDVQVRSLIRSAATRFVDYLGDPVSEGLRRVPPVGKHRYDYHSPYILPTIYTGKEFFEHFGKNRGGVMNRTQFRRGGGGRGRGGYGRGGGGYRSHHGGPRDPYAYPHMEQDDRLPKRDRREYDDDSMDVVKRSRIDMPLQSS